MAAGLAWAAAVLTALGAALLATLAARRLQLARRDQRLSQREQRLRPLALALMDGEEIGATGLAPADVRALAGLLARYGRWVAGDSRGRIASFLEEVGAVEDALRLLSHRRAWRRATGAWLLGEMGSPRVERALLAALETDPERDVRAAAARSLGRLGSTAAVGPLVQALAGGSVPRAVAGAALLAIGTDALPALREHERSAEAEVRAAAVELVGLLGDAAEAAVLVERLGDSSAETRARAARALGRLGAGEAADALRRTLHDRIPFVRANAAHALGEIGDRLALPALLELAAGDDHDAAQAAARAAARIDPDAVARAAGADPYLAEAADLAALR